MRDVVICSPLRTPVGRFGGVFKTVDAATLGSRLVAAILDRTRLDASAVDEVILGQASPNGEAPAIGRVVALDSDLGLRVTGRQVDRRCGSGLQAIVDAAMQVATGAGDVILAGGVENMSQAEHYVPGLRWGGHGETIFHDRLERARSTAGGEKHFLSGGTLETAETLRSQYKISREEQDALAFLSHQKAVAAQKAGLFDQELVPIPVASRKGVTIVDRDEHPRADTSLESLASLKPVRLREDPQATVTAGNASGQNDGAAITIVTTAKHAEALGLVPMARLVSWAAAGVAPEVMGIGAVPATAKALERAELRLKNLDILELNEAFAAQALAVLREWSIPMTDPRLNPCGSGISLGHPVGATGARIVVTLLHAMARTEARYGLATMCIAGGQGIAAVFERYS